MVEPGQIVLPVRIDQRVDRRQRLVGLMMVDRHHVEAELLRLGERLDAGGAAVDGHQQPRALLGERADRLGVRAVAFEQAVRNVDQRLDAGMAQELRQHRRRGRAVDVVVAEDRDRSRRSIASAMRAAAFAMSVSMSGSGISRRTVGSRNSSTSSTSTSRPASMRASSSDTPWRCVIASARAVAALVEPVAPGAPAHRCRTSRKSRGPVMRANVGSALVRSREWRTSAASRSIACSHAAIAAAYCGLSYSGFALATCLSRISTSACAAPAQILRIGRVALRQRFEILLVLQRCRVGDDGGGLARFAEQEIERPAVEALQAVRCLMLDPLQRRDMRADRGLRVAAEPAAARGIRVLD